jgi:hypothetical protein
MQRSTVVTVFGILNIIFAALGLFGLVASVMVFTATGSSSNNPVIQTIHNNPSYAAWLKISLVLGMGASAALLAAGIGLLNLKPWARTLSIIYAIYAIVNVLVGGVANYIFLIQPMMQQAQQKQGPEAAGAIGGAVGGMFGTCFGLVYPVLLLIFMLRPKVVAAFRPSGLPGDQL